MEFWAKEKDQHLTSNPELRTGFLFDFSSSKEKNFFFLLLGNKLNVCGAGEECSFPLINGSHPQVKKGIFEREQRVLKREVHPLLFFLA